MTNVFDMDSIDDYISDNPTPKGWTEYNYRVKTYIRFYKINKTLTYEVMILNTDILEDKVKEKYFCNATVISQGKLLMDTGQHPFDTKEKRDEYCKKTINIYDKMFNKK